MRLRDVRVVLLTGPCTDDPWLSVFKQTRSAAFVEVETDAGVIGIGETYAGYFFPESVPLIVDYLKDILLNAAPFEDPATLDIATLTHRMRTCCAYWGRVGLGAAVIAGIEGALWDLLGRLLDQPVCELLGGSRQADLPAYATGGPSPWPTDQLLEKADFYLGLGFTAFKVSSGYVDSGSREEVRAGSADEAVATEVEKLALLRDHVGPDAGILLDGHMGHREGDDRWDLETASRVLDALAPFGVFLFEEPLPYTDLPGYVALTERSPIPVAGGEQLTTFEEFRTFVVNGAFTIGQPDAAWLGVGDFVRTAKLLAEQGNSVAPHAWGAGGAVMQNVHAAFASPNTVTVEIPPAAGPLHREIWGDSLVIRDGRVLRPEAPGLGIELTDRVKEAYPFRPGAEEFASVPGKVMRS